jgi:putative hemolysin
MIKFAANHRLCYNLHTNNKITDNMATLHNQLLRYLLLSVCLLSPKPIFADTALQHISYCEQAGGKVENMSAQIGINQGFTRRFCTFHIDHGFIVVGLATFSSTIPNIAATYIKTLATIKEDSPLILGPFTPNIGANLCKNIGGTEIAFISSGGFTNPLGQADVCVFGDGSMVSAWSLYYIANERSGYELVKNKVNSKPLILS